MEIADKKFQSNCQIDLKKRLDALHYCHPVTPHSAILVETLLNDLLKSSQLSDKLKAENKQLAHDSKESTDTISMYQREISRIGIQNNDLHSELMNIKELQASSQEKWRVACKKLESECEDLKSLNSIQQSKFSELEAEKDKVKARLDRVLTKIYNPGSEKGLKDQNLSVKEQNAVKKQEFRISASLNPSENLRGLTKSQHEWAQELQDSDERLKQCQEQIEDLISMKEDLIEEVQRGKEKVKSRDLEIERLVGILNDGEFAVKVPKRVGNRESIEKVLVLNERMDFVNSENVKMEKELRIARERLAQVGNVHEERDLLLGKLEEALRENKKLKGIVENLPDGNKDSGDMDSQIWEYQNEIEDLKEKCGILQETINKLEKSKNEVSIDLENFEQTFERLKKENKSLLDRSEEAETLKLTAENKLKKLEYSLEISETKVQNLEKKLEISQQTYHRLYTDHSSVNESIHSVNKSLLDLETKNSILESELSSQKQENSRLSKQKEALELKFESLTTENMKSRTEADINLTSKQRLNIQLESLERQNSNLQSENQTLSQLVQSHKRANLDAERKIRELTGSNAANEEHIRILQRDQKASADELYGQIETLRKIEGCKLALERENIELAVYKQKWESSLNELKRVKEMLNEAEVEVLRNKKELSDGRENVRRKEEEIKELEEVIAEVKMENKKLSGEIEIAEISRENYSGNSRKLQYLEEELSRTAKLLENSLGKEKLLYKESENFKNANKKLEEQIGSLGKQHERLLQSSQILENENFKLQKIVSELQVEKNQRSTDLIRLEERLYQCNLELDEVKRELSNNNDENYRFVQECKEVKSALAGEQSENSRLNDQIYQLKQFIETLENSRDNVMRKLETANVLAKDLQDKIEALKDEIAAIKRNKT